MLCWNVNVFFSRCTTLWSMERCWRDQRTAVAEVQIDQRGARTQPWLPLCSRRDPKQVKAQCLAEQLHAKFQLKESCSHDYLMLNPAAISNTPQTTKNMQLNRLKMRAFSCASTKARSINDLDELFLAQQ